MALRQCRSYRSCFIAVRCCVETILAVLLLLRGDLSEKKYLWCRKCLWCLLLTRVSPSAYWTPTALPSSVPAFLRDLIAGCWSLAEIRVRGRVTHGCWSCVGIRLQLLQQSSYTKPVVVAVSVNKLGLIIPVVLGVFVFAA